MPYFICVVTWSRLHTGDFRKAFSVHAKTRTSFSPDFQLFGCLAATTLGNHVKHTAADNSAQVLDLAALHFHMKNSHSFLMLVCSR